jgi:hypothetical protein
MSREPCKNVGAGICHAMNVFRCESPRFEVTAPQGWYDVTHEQLYDEGTLALVRYLADSDQRTDSSGGGYLILKAEGGSKGIQSRTTPQMLLDALLSEGKDNEWGEPEKIISAQKPSPFAEVSYSYLDPLFGVKSYARLSRLVRGGLVFHVRFSTENFDVSPRESRWLLSESEAIVRSLKVGLE